VVYGLEDESKDVNEKLRYRKRLKRSRSNRISGDDTSIVGNDYQNFAAAARSSDEIIER